MTYDPDFKVTTFLKSNIGKPARLKDKFTIAQEETILLLVIWPVWPEITYSRPFWGVLGDMTGFPLELSTVAKGQNTRVLGLPNGRKSFKIGLAV